MFINKTLRLTGGGALLALVVAGSGSSSSTGAPAGTTTTLTENVLPQAPGEDVPVAKPDGHPGRVSVDEHCCYGTTYFRCPNATACFGGFDLGACLSSCADGACEDACSASADAAGAPKGCRVTAPPVGVDCTNGSIEVARHCS
jgi:hypothetical protein